MANVNFTAPAKIYGFPQKNEFVAIGNDGNVAMIPIDQVPYEVIALLDDVDVKWLKDIQGYRADRIARRLNALDMAHRKQKTSTTYHVAIKQVNSEGLNVTSFIGPALHSRFQLKKALKRIRRTRPEATSGRFVDFH